MFASPQGGEVVGPKDLRDLGVRVSQWGPRLMATAFQHIEEFMIAFSIALGGVLVGYIVYRIIMCTIGTRGRAVLKNAQDKDGTSLLYQRRGATGDLEWGINENGKIPDGDIWSRWSRTTVTHLVALFLRCLIIIVGLYVAFDAVGIDMGTLVASLGIVAAVVTFAARDLIVNTAAAFCLLTTGLVQEGMYIVTSGVKGTVFRVHSLNTLMLERNGPLGKIVVHSIPNYMFFATTVSRVIDLEKGIDPSVHSAILDRVAIVESDMTGRMSSGQGIAAADVVTEVPSAVFRTGARSKII
jgi:small-conductance mechanosensitive channel